MSNHLAEEFLARHDQIIKRVARREHKGATTVDRDDLEQVLREFFLQNISSTHAFSEDGVEGTAVKVARKYMFKERIDVMHFRGCFIYTPKIVETFLQDAVWKQIEDVPDIDGRVDVTREYNRLPAKQRQLLFRKYALGEPPLASDRAGRRMVERAIDTITARLNLNAQEKWTDLEQTV